MNSALESKTLNEVLFEINESSFKSYFVRKDKKIFNLDSLSMTSFKWINIEVESHFPKDFLFDKITELLADLATKHWPYWYDEEPSLHLQKISELAPAESQDTTTQWYNQIRYKAELGLPPVADSLSLNINAKELLRLYSPTPVVIFLSLVNQSITPEKVKQMVDIALWFKQLNIASVALFLPAALKGSPLVEKISQNSEVIEEIAESLEIQGYIKPKANPYNTKLQRGSNVLPIQSYLKNSRHNKPISLSTGLTIGKPHPLSPGENLLYRALMQDLDLKELFECNNPVQGYSGKTYISDFTFGNRLIQIAGFQQNAEYIKSCNDQRKDLDLALNGYQIIRIPYQDIVFEIDRVVEQIKMLCSSSV